MPQPKIYINVPMSEAERKRVEREEHFWTAPRLVGLMFASLAVALTVLYSMANYVDGGKSETYWDTWLYPGGMINELTYEELEPSN